MWLESRRWLALIGDEKVTICAFFGLLLYGAALLFRRDSRPGRIRAWLIVGGAALWLVAALSGTVSGDLARWSSLAVFLFTIGVEGRTSADGPRQRRPIEKQNQEAPEISTSSDRFDAPTIAPPSVAGHSIPN